MFESAVVQYGASCIVAPQLIVIQQIGKLIDTFELIC